MAKTITTKLDTFDGGLVNDPLLQIANVCRVCTNFDTTLNSHHLIPHTRIIDGDSNSSTSQKANFSLAIFSGTTYRLYGLGVVSGTARAEILNKELKSSGSGDNLITATWNMTSNYQSPAGTTSFNLFVYYKKTGLIYGARDGSTIWAYDPTGSGAFNNSENALVYTNIAEGLVHSKDDILYIPYDNKIAKNNNGSWTDVAITLPSDFKINAIAEYGNFLAIAASPVSGVGKSVVYLWDRDASLETLSESIQWGNEALEVLQEVDGYLVGISSGVSATNIYDDVVFRFYLQGQGAIEFNRLRGDNGGIFELRKSLQKVRNRLHFMLQIKLNGVQKDGVWSVGRTKSGQFSVIHEHTLDNTEEITGGTMRSFIYAGDFLVTAYHNGTIYKISITKPAGTSNSATAIYETQRFGDSKELKRLKNITINTEFLPASNSQIVVKYKKDEETSFTTIMTHDTEDALSKTAITIESTGSPLPEYREIEFRLESTNGAIITGFEFDSTINEKKI